MFHRLLNMKNQFIVNMRNKRSKLMEKMGLKGDAHPFAVSQFLLKLISVDPETPNGSLLETIKLFSIIIIAGFPVFLGLGGTSIMAKSGLVHSDTFCYQTCSLKCSMMYEKIESLSYIVHTFVLSSYGLTYVYFGYELKVLSYKIGVGRFGRSNDFLHNCYTLNKNTLRILALIAFVVFIQANYNYFWNSHCNSKNQLNDGKFVCGLVLTAWYPFKIDTRAEYTLIMIWYFAFCIVFVPLGVSFSITLYGFPMFMITKMKCLRKEVEQIREVKSDCFRRKFRKFVEEYGEILECMKELNNTLGYIYSTQYVFVNIAIGLVVYNVLLMKSIVDIGRMCIWSIMEYILCKTCQNLEDEHDNLTITFYDLPWYDLDPDMRQNYRILFACIHLPLQVKSQPFSVVNNAFYLYIMRGTYSIMTFFFNFNK